VGHPPQAWAHKYDLVQLSTNTSSAAQSVADRLTILDVFARYGIAYDEGRNDVLETLFTEDARFEVTEGRETPHVCLRGRTAIIRQIAAVFAQQADQRRHFISNVTFESLKGDTATCLAYGIVTVANDGLSVGATVIYAADLRRSDDGAWCFTRLLIGMDSYAGRKPTTSPRG
jgi:hypothetical protein